MGPALSAPVRRAQAYAYTLATTAVVLLFALAEWAAERYISDRSRVASSAVEAAIVVAAALVFRPVHRRVEGAMEAAFYKRKRQALAALERFRREMSSFNDLQQLLRRTVDALEEYLETRGCAVYLHRDVFRAEASSFETPAESVGDDDPLVVRLRSSGASARPPVLKSAACGTHAFPMTTAGDLVGFVCLHARRAEYDVDELHALSALAGDLATAAIALDPRLRPRRTAVPNNLPANRPALIGREREAAELEAAFSQARLITVTGAGGVGKTSIALECAANLMRSREHGAWLVHLSPIGEGRSVAPAVLAALGAERSQHGDDVSALVEYLRSRDAILLLDNCEHVLEQAAAIVQRILAECPKIAVLATSREMLHVDGEQVYRLGPLRPEPAAELFARRAAAVSPAFALRNCAGAVREICEHLDGIPLAIELAAARVRTLSAAEISERLHERFRLLTGGARTAVPHHRTLGAMIEWSYDLLSREEQSLFLSLAVFRGSFSLGAACAVCPGDDRCDEFHVLDVLTSLADKSLLTVALGLTTRYRLLETLREFAEQKASERQGAVSAQNRHAAYFAGAASRAYHEFDSQLPQGWLEQLTPDLDNFRAALAWTLEGGGDRRMGAQLAADCGPMFLRLGLLAEGLHWCDVARAVREVSPATSGRIEYVASMMHNNLGQNRRALEHARSAVDAYRDSSDERGLVRALSQTAQLYARTNLFDRSQEPAAEAVLRARALGEPRVLIGVLRRCAHALPPAHIDEARAQFAEALELARSARDPEEVCMVLEWWAGRESAAGYPERAIDLGSEALQCAHGVRLLSLEIDVAGWAIALGRFEQAKPHALQALLLAGKAQHPLAQAVALAFFTPFHAERDARAAAKLFGYANARLDELEWQPQSDDDLAFRRCRQALEDALPPDELRSLLAQGAALREDEAAALVDVALSTAPETSLSAVRLP